MVQKNYLVMVDKIGVRTWGTVVVWGRQNKGRKTNKVGRGKKTKNPSNDLG